MAIRALVSGCAGAMLVLVGCSVDAGPAVVVDGLVDLGPFCPVESAASPCVVPPGAFAGVEAVASDGEVEVRGPVAGDGRFRLLLPDGEWQVTATAGMSCDAVTVRRSATVTITCDTGIR